MSLVLALIGFMLGSPGVTIGAQQNMSKERARSLVNRLETNMDRFSQSVDTALDRSRLDNSEVEDQINALVDEMEYSTDRLEDRVGEGPIASDVTEVLGDALRLDAFMLKHRLSAAAERDWAQVRSVLDEMAKSYNVAWVWTVTNNPTLSNASKRRVINRLETRADEFRESFDNALDKTRADGTRFEDHMNNVVSTFEKSLDNLEDQVNLSDELKEKDVMIVLNNAQAVDDYMRKYKMTPRAWLDWVRVKVNLDDLARLSKVTWAWVVKPGATAVVPADANVK